MRRPLRCGHLCVSLSFFLFFFGLTPDVRGIYKEGPRTRARALLLAGDLKRRERNTNLPLGHVDMATDLGGDLFLSSLSPLTSSRGCNFAARAAVVGQPWPPSTRPVEIGRDCMKRADLLVGCAL